MDNIEKEAENLIKAMTSDMENYTAATVKEIEAAVETEEREMRRSIKAASPVRTGKYKRGWRKHTFVHKDGRYLLAAVQADPHWRRVHLLELGHRIFVRGKGGKMHDSGRKTRPVPHVERFQAAAYANLDKKLKKILKGD